MAWYQPVPTHIVSYWSDLSPWQVSPQEMVQEIHQVLMDREDTCHRTCFSLHLDGNMLDHFSELRSVEGLQEGSVLRVVEGWSRLSWWLLDEGPRIRPDILTDTVTVVPVLHLGTWRGY